MAAGATYEPIATTTLGTAAADITFSSIPATYTDLKLILASGSSGGSGSPVYIGIQFNGDTATNYGMVRLYSDGTSAGSVLAANLARAQIGIGKDQGTINTLLVSNIFSYAGSTFKTAFTESSANTNGGGNAERFANTWRSTAAITSIKVFYVAGTNLIAGSTATLYGIKAA